MWLFALFFKFPSPVNQLIFLLWKIQHTCNPFIQNADTTRRTRSNITWICGKIISRNPAVKSIRDHTLPVLLQDWPDSGGCLDQARPVLLSVFSEFYVAAFWVSKIGKEKVKEIKSMPSLNIDQWIILPKQCNNLVILPPTFGSNYFSKPKSSYKSKMFSKKSENKKLNRDKVSIIQHESNMTRIQCI